MWYLDVNSEKTDFLILSPPDDIHLILKLAPVLSKKSEKMHLAHTFCSSTRLREVPHFSSGIVERAKREHAWKSPHARKGDTRWGERKMRDYRQSPSFWPFTADWFWSVKFVSPSKSIKCIQWYSFPHWAVIALVIGEQVWFLPLISNWEVVTRILIFCGYCLWHDLSSDARALSLTSFEK